MSKCDEPAAIGVYEARTHFSELLERVEKGEEVTITHHSVPVARLVPVKRTSTPEERRAAIAAMRRLASGNNLGGLHIKGLIADGRR